MFKLFSSKKQDVVSRIHSNEDYQTMYDISFEPANDIFLETKQWLWLYSQVTCCNVLYKPD